VVAPTSVNGRRSRHHVHAKVFDGGIQGFLDRRAQPVDLVDEQHVTAPEPRELAGERAFVIDGGPARDVQAHPHLAREDVRERRLAEPRRATQQDVIERLAALFGGLHVHLQVLPVLRLPDEVGQALRPKQPIETRVIRGGLGVELARSLDRGGLLLRGFAGSHASSVPVSRVSRA